MVDAADETPYEGSFDLPPNRADEANDPFGGDPTRVLVTEDGDDRAFEWPMPDCEDRGDGEHGRAEPRTYTVESPVLRGTCNTVTLS